MTKCVRVLVLLWFAFMTWSMSLPAAAQTYTPAPEMYRYCVNTQICNVWKKTVPEAQADYCPGQVAWNQANAGVTVTCKLRTASQSNTDSYFINAEFTNPDGSKFYDNRTAYVGWYCVDGSTPNGNHQCVSNPAGSDPCAGKDIKNPFIRSFAYAPGAVSGSLPVDDGQCKITGVTLLRCYQAAGNQKYCYFRYYQTTIKKDDTVPTAPVPNSSLSTDYKPKTPTDTTTTSPALSPDAATGNCPGGTVQAGFDRSGIPICIGTGNAPANPATPPPTTTKPATTTTNSDGSSITKQDTLQTNTDGSITTTTTTTTKAADGSQTVMVSAATTANANGDPGKQDTPNADQSSLCKQNPNLSICQNSTVTGSCENIACTGDAIQCATLRAAAQMQCKQKKDADDIAASSALTLGQAAASGADPAASTLPKVSNASTVTVPSTLDQSGWLGSSSGLSDVNFSLQGKAFTIPLAKTGSYLIGLRYAMMVVALLVSFRMLSGVILRE